MKKGTFEDLLPQETVERMLLSRVSVGEVFRMHLGKEENIKGKNPGDDGRNKYFVVLGHDLDGNAIGVVIIDTEINPNLPPRRQQMHYQLSAKKYAFLKEKDRFVDCSDLKTITGKRFKELFGNGKAKGTIMQDENSKKRPLRVVYLSPQGDVFNQKMAEEMAQEEDLVLLCGHYEGIDERVLEEIVTDYVSIGDYVLTGGELPAMVMIDTISRLVPGVLHNDVSAEFESFQDNLLEYPQYSRPEEWRGKKVPPILLSGHHANIEKWRREQSILRTMERRPDLLKESNLTDKEKKWIRQVKRERKEAEKMK